jgi:multiple sugar transport system ATP-binding protein
MAEVTLTNITKKFGDFTAVDNLSMIIEDGKFTVLVGPSGCGKTTTLRMIAGLETITEGEIRIGERVVNKIPPKDRDIAMVFQNYALYPHMDVYDNMAFGLKLRKQPKKEIDKLVNDAAELLGIEEKLKSKPRELSGGQRQRVAVGRAIVRKPKVFLFDEPLSNLDAKLRVQMRTELEELHSRLKTTTIYVTHDQVEAMTLGDRIAVMKDGVINQYASPQETYSSPSNLFVAGFIGSPAMNFIRATASFENGQTILAGTSFRIALPPERSSEAIVGEVQVGVRPEEMDGPCPSADNALSLKVAVKEHLGHTMLVYGYIEDVQIVASLDPHSQVEVGEDIYLAVNTEALHIFDPATEAMLL